MRETDVSPSRDELAAWCRKYVADLLERPVDAIDLTADFDRLGMDSALAASLLIEVEERYGIELPPEALFENPTLDAVVTYLHEHLETAGDGRDDARGR
jgi:acyl carrier protein